MTRGMAARANADLKHPYLQKVHETFTGLEEDRGGRKALLRLLLHLYATQHADLLGVKPTVFRLGPQEGLVMAHYALRDRIY